MAGFVFYDTETTGLNPGWDQIVHFAAIRTDEHLKEVSQFEVRCQLQPHILPHPSALLVNGISIRQLTDPSLPSHYDMLSQIRRRLLQWSPTIIVGYNSIRFDEEMLRHDLFQCLHPAYLTSSHQNSRTDVLSLALAAASFPPQCIKAPLNELGRPTFQLQSLAAFNELNIRNGHNALGDVEVTLDLARKIKANSLDAWSRFVRFSKKSTVAEFVGAEDAFVLTEFFGNEAYHRVVTCIGSVPSNPNGRLCLDLSSDPRDWAELNDESLHLAISRKGGPVRRLAVNAAPTLTPLWEASEEMLSGLPIDLAEKRGQWLKSDAATCSRIIKSYISGWSDAPTIEHPEDLLYHGGFVNSSDEQRMIKFHDAHPSLKHRLVEEFDDPRLSYFGRRLIHSQHRNVLNEAECHKRDLALANRLLYGGGKATSLDGALSASNELLKNGAHDPNNILGGYCSWLSQRKERVRQFQSKAYAGKDGPVDSDVAMSF